MIFFSFACSHLVWCRNKRDEECRNGILPKTFWNFAHVNDARIFSKITCFFHVFCARLETCGERWKRQRLIVICFFVLAACQWCKTCFVPHVFKCKERYHPHPIQLRSISHVCKCKRCYYPPISVKARLRVNVIVDFYVMRPSALGFRIFLQGRVCRSNPSRFLVFSHR